MTTPAQVRKAALALPGVEEDSGEFSVHGTVFVTVTTGKTLVLHPDTDGAPQNTPLAELNGMETNHWVRRAWFAAAPSELAGPLAAADDAVAGEVGDLPRAIGNPATKALVAHGVTSLADLAGHALDDVAQWHGVGPKAIRILRDAVT